jgi:hypothetical protein
MSTSFRTIAIAAGLAAVLGTTAACGDDEPAAAAAKESAGIPTISEAEFTRVGNELCEANGQAVAANFERFSSPPKPEEFQHAYDTMIKESYKIVGQFLALGAPEGKETAFYDILVEAQQVTEAVEADGSEAFFATEEDPWEDTVAVLVDDFGLTGCAHEG